jgi:similar to spore coat protein
MLMSAKSAVKNYALAITETATPEVRHTLIQHLEEAVEGHKQISTYMINKGYYHPNDTSKQLQLDMNTAKTALNVAKD